LPPEFHGIAPLADVSILLPHSFQNVVNPGESRFTKPNYIEWEALGRLQSGSSIQSVQTNLRSFEPSFRRMADPENQLFGSTLFSNTTPGSLVTVWDGRLGITPIKTVLPPILAMEGLAAAILLFCGCNVTLLFLARAGREAHAAAIRAALGARLITELRFAALECGLLAALGCIVGVPLSWAVLRAFAVATASASQFEIISAIYPSTTQVAWFVGMALVLASLLGAAIRLYHGKQEARIGLQQGRTATSMRSRGWIIALEVLVALPILASTILCSAGLRRAATQPSGFDEHGPVVASFDIGRRAAADPSGVRGPGGGERLRRVLERIEASPGVESVAEINVPPLSGATSSALVSAYGQRGGLRQLQIWPADVSAQYFSTIGTRILRGRAFRLEDVPGGPVCVLSNRAANELFSSDNPLGKSLYQGGFYCRIIGVSENAHFKSMTQRQEAVVYRLTDVPMPSVIVRASTTSLAIQAIRDAATSVDPGMLASTIDTVAMRMDADLRIQRVLTLAGMSCAALSGMILTIGFFGVLSLQVSERKREIGIAVALGASRIGVCAFIARKLRASLVFGLVLGSLFSFLASDSLIHLFGLNAFFAIAAYLGSLAMLGVLLALAGFVPVRRALNVSPMECLSSE